jgi:hypothetical protein
MASGNWIIHEKLVQFNEERIDLVKWETACLAWLKQFLSFKSVIYIVSSCEPALYHYLRLCDCVEPCGLKPHTLAPSISSLIDVCYYECWGI